MLDRLSVNLEIRFASFCNPGNILIRVRSKNAVRFPSKGRNDLPQSFVDASQEKQGKAGEQSCTDAVPPESKCDGAPNYRDGWNCVVNPVGRQISNHVFLARLNKEGNPPLHFGGKRAFP